MMGKVLTLVWGLEVLWVSRERFYSARATKAAAASALFYEGVVFSAFPDCCYSSAKEMGICTRISEIQFWKAEKLMELKCVVQISINFAYGQLKAVPQKPQFTNWKKIQIKTEFQKPKWPNWNASPKSVKFWLNFSTRGKTQLGKCN